jgi:hypothetical protein
MGQAPPSWGSYALADPIWWTKQQLRVMTATATYLTRVTEAVAGAAVPRVSGAAAVPAETAEPSVPVAVDEPALPAAVEEPTAADEAPDEELPVPRWDELSLGSIRARLSRLSEADLVTLHLHEERHGGRPEVLSMLANRLTKVRQGNGPAAGV